MENLTAEQEKVLEKYNRELHEAIHTARPPTTRRTSPQTDPTPQPPTEPTKQGDVTASIDRLSGVIGQLEKGFDTLTATLSPILRPSQPRETEDKPARESICELADMIYGLAARVRQVEEVLTDVTERIEL